MPVSPEPASDPAAGDAVWLFGELAEVPVDLSEAVGIPSVLV
jgi:hypothetical protein